MKSKFSKADLELVSKTIAMLSVDAVEKANSGHPGMPMGSADQAAVLWLNHLNYNSKDSAWLNRDRFILSNGHGSMLQYSLLHLAGFDLSIEDLKNFRQLHSKTPGHPESFITDGVECTTGPLGQGIANAVGMAIGEKIFASKYNTDKYKIFDHKIYCFLGDGCLMEGISSEACSIAGHLGLNNLIAMYDDNHISIAGDTNLTFTENVKERFESQGWYVQCIDGHDVDAIDSAISNARNETQRPSLIALRTVIGKGSPNKANTGGVHGSPLGKDELELTKKGLDWQHEAFYVPQATKDAFSKRNAELGEKISQWNETFEAWSKENNQLFEDLEKQLSLSFENGFFEKLFEEAKAFKKGQSSRKISSDVLQIVAKGFDGLVGGAADLEPSTLTVIKDSSSISKDSFSGANIHFGVREHAMGAILNGLSYYGGFIPFGSTFLTFSDYMRPAIRIAALSGLRTLFIFTHDSIFLGEDGPTHQAVEHIQSFRMMPNVYVLRPGTNEEVAVSYQLALTRKEGPSLLVFSRQNIAELENYSPTKEQVEKGAYKVSSYGSGDLVSHVVLATGSELPLAQKVAKELANKGSTVSFVSAPCVEKFLEQPKEYCDSILPDQAKVIVVEAGTSFGWSDLLSKSPKELLVIGVDSFGTSAPQKELEEEFGFTVKKIIDKIDQKWG